MTAKNQDSAGDEPTDRQRPGRPLTPQARRALAEAEARRAAQEASDTAKQADKEIGGRDGPEPTRYGDWEAKGRISDF